MIGPALGVYLGTQGADWLPYSVAAIFSLVQLVFFLLMRLQEPRGEMVDVVQSASPLRFIRRYFKQPRLVLAWLLSVTRAGWWGLFYNIAPIYLVANGVGAETIGVITSIGSAGMLTVIFWGWVGRQIGIRALFMPAYATAGTLTILVTATNGYPLVGAILLIMAAAATSVIDSCGNLAFLRAVRPWERSEMTTVFATYRDISRVASQGLYVNGGAKRDHLGGVRRDRLAAAGLSP